ncbi:uncharacterized protein LOC110714476 isoform X2 [Chenopodium quinoa]|uniref:uncharacterized protein LOC110714476 isoform X2 n=1 Tax=Chenopodium quinoa TaxID=63459 RepID=UPI000B78F099|nr:uncharacterized protein LOC110714476 isoform X2 [Chenopodium quinoa]
MMANLQANHQILNISRTLSISGESKSFVPFVITKSLVLIHKNKCIIRGGLLKVACISSSDNSNSSALVQQRPPSTDEELGMMIDQTAEIEIRKNEGFDESKEIDYLVKEYGWKVRRMKEDKSEMKMVAQVQAEAFHVPSLFFDDWFFSFFQAEVLAGLIYRLRNSPPDRYACLVAEPAKEHDRDTSMNSQAEQVQQQLVGVVDVTVLRDNDVMQHLQGAPEYLYVSGIAVSQNFSIYICSGGRK